MSKSHDLMSAHDKAHFIHPYTNLKLHEQKGPVIMERGKGVYVYDDAGKAYVEGVAALWCTTLGFSEKRLIKAAKRQMKKLPYYHSFGHRAHPAGIALADKLLEIAPVPMSKVFFATSGSEANDSAVKLIWYYNNAIGRPKKKKIISRLKGYHGVTIVSGSLTGLPHVHRDFDLPLPQILHTDCPSYYHYAQSGETPEQFAQRMAKNLEDLILREGPETIAAFIAEPIQGVGGIIIPPPGYFAYVQAILKKYDILLIADEVVTGFGRTGNMWGSQTCGMTPDLMVIAKGLSSAYQPISALLIPEMMYQAMVKESEKIGTFGHGFTHTAHPVASAVALETLRVYEEDRILENIRRVGAYLTHSLAPLKDHPLVGDVRTVGLMAGVELVQDKLTKKAFDPTLKVGPMVFDMAFKRGAILRAMGDVIAFSPPLIIQEKHIDVLVKGLKEALDEAWKSLKNQGLVK